MATHSVPNRYVARRDLISLLESLFPGQYSVEEHSDAWVVSGISRRLTESLPSTVHSGSVYMEPPQFPTTRSLFSRLTRIRIENKQCKKFIPEDELFRLLAVSESQIKQVLKGVLPREDVGEVADVITTRARKVFSILVLNNHARHIRSFITSDQLQHADLDTALPFDKSKLRRIMSDEDAVEAFYERQWEFCAPRFQGGIIPRRLDPHTIMPYVEEDMIASGGKEQLPDTTTTYENEVHVLSTLQSLAHPNILRLVACYTYEDKHNLVSPFIPGGTLHKYLRQPKSGSLTREKMFCMMAGLASSISALHIFTVDEETEPAYKGQHQDLWGENILVDKDRFILADFGLSSMKRMSQSTPTKHKGRKGYYQAPECADLEEPYQEHSTTRASDIFSLGCIFTDLLVYLVFGPEGTMKFREARKFTIPPLTYRVYHKSKYNHEAVDAWLEMVLENNRSEGISEAVRLIKKMLEVDPNERPKANEVTAIIYDCTVRAFSEKIIKCFDQFESIEEAVIEKARYSSWALFQEPIVYMTSAGATAVQEQFMAVVNSLTQMLETLKSIGHSPGELDHRSINELRPLNLELLNKLSPSRRALADENLTSTLLDKFGSTIPSLNPNIAQYDIGYSAIIRRARTKRLVAMAEDEKATSPGDDERYYFISDPVIEQGPIGEFKIGTISRRGGPPVPVIIEQIKYYDSVTWHKHARRIKALCDLLGSDDVVRNFRVPAFYGARERRNEWVYELLYRIPRNDSPRRPPQAPTSLYALLKGKDLRYGPWESRSKLAARLADALANFHEVNWFHKNLTSSNVLFFPSHIIPPAEVTAQPYLVGFQYSRRDAEDATEGPLQDPRLQRYHHPAYVDTESRRFARFEPRFDRYSLGVLLLEIGLWSPIEDIMRGHETDRNAFFSEVLKEKAMPQLTFQMGTQYADIVHQCLTDLRVGEYPTAYSGGLEQSSNFLFKQAVVIPLRSLAASRQIVNPGIPNRKRPYHDGNNVVGSMRPTRRLRVIPPKF
ncbi:hypothetical protein BJY01DRAFT_250336 [Aspergillus pseudoustus]|uniref:Protein kinase domain-containing protein n=1 Tax=Aspergillus pseudoustus TaxID=1810923 RepID=A0ABR4JI75_9EURO